MLAEGGLFVESRQLQTDVRSGGKNWKTSVLTRKFAKHFETEPQRCAAKCWLLLGFERTSKELAMPALPNRRNSHTTLSRGIPAMTCRVNKKRRRGRLSFSSKIRRNTA